MNLVKTTLTTLTVCSILALPLVNQAAAAPNSMAKMEQGHQKHHMKHKMFKRMAKFLKLTTEQRAQLKAFKETEKADREALKPSLEAFRDEMATLIKADSFDEAAAQQLQANYKDTFAQLGLLKAKSKHNFWSVLTEEQRAKLELMKEKRQMDHDEIDD